MNPKARTKDERMAETRAGKAGALPAELFERSDAKGLNRLGVHAGLLGCTGLLVAASWPALGSVPAMLLHGVVLTFVFSPLHECIHATAFNSRRLNDAVAFVCGFVLLLPKEYFRAFHLEHHRSTQDPQRDPELAANKPGTPAQYLFHVSGLPYWCDRIKTILRHARGNAGEPFIAKSKRGLIVGEARLHLVLYMLLAAASLTLQSSALVIYWIVPVVAGQPFLRAFLLAEHTGCPMVSDMLVNSRTTRTHFLVKLITWNMPYHAEHHAWAAVPFHHLPRVHQLVRERIANTAQGYVAVHRSLWRSLDRA